MYDSGYNQRVPTGIERSVANILCTPEDTIYVRIMNNDVQPNSSDCGLYAIAFAVSLAYGKDPVYIQYDNKLMRSHLLKCIKNNKITEFPQSTVTRSVEYTHVHSYPVYCTCRMPDEGFMFVCTGCQNWFHPQCQEIKLSERQVKKSRNIKCLQCRN